MEHPSGYISDNKTTLGQTKNCVSTDLGWGKKTTELECSIVRSVFARYLNQEVSLKFLVLKETSCANQ